MRRFEGRNARSTTRGDVGRGSTPLWGLLSPIALSLQPVGLPHGHVRPCHRRGHVSGGTGGVMLALHADPRPLRPPCGLSAEPGAGLPGLIPPTCPLPLAWP